MKVKKIEHIIYKEWRKVKKEYKEMGLPKIVDRWQYIYFSKKGKISLVKLIDCFADRKYLWEIYCLEGNLFRNIERFKTKGEAEKRIRRLLE